MKKSQDSESVSVCSAAATNGPQRKRGFSLRRLLVASHLIGHRPARSHSAKQQKNTSTLKDADTKSTGVGSSSKDAERGSASELHKATSRTSVFATSTKSSAEASALVECPLCLEEVTSYALAELAACGHRSCYTCLSVYLRIEISESRVQIACPECAEPMHPNEIRAILDDAALYEKYEDFMVRRVLAVDPDTRWCPAPDCGYAVIASGCASCPKIKCQRPGCLAHFCYHCKAEWHPNQTCDAARAQRSPNVRSSSVSFSQDSAHRDDIKPCPRCAVLIVKMDDGSCNHMMCAVCGAEFCWLCMKEISDLHYLSPSGCTFWGKKPWSRKKKILWQLGTLVGAPVGIALVAGIAVPAMIIGIPVWVGRKLYTRYRLANKHKRNAAIVGGAIASVLISPVLAGLAVGIGVPILLFYVYGVVPVSLCRSGGCGVSTSSGGVKFEFDDELSQTSASVRHADNLDSRETASNVAVAGSIGSGSAMSTAVQRLEVQAEVASAQRFSMSSETASQSASLSEKSVNVSIADDGGASTRALAGSVLNCKAATSDTCSCIAEPDDCSSERVRFDDNISFIAPYPDKVSIGSSCSFRTRCGKTSSASVTKSPLHVADNSDSISIDMSSAQVDSPGDKKRSATEILRSVFFRSTIDDGIEIQKPLPVIEEPMPPPPLPVEEATEA